MGQPGGNAVETELKYLGADAGAVRAALQAAGAKLESPRQLEVNLVFDDEAGSLRAAGRLLRLRDGHELTVKLPLEDDRFKAQREITVHVADGPVEELLGGLGYQARARYEKYREGWDLDGMWVTIDDLPFLGTVVEIEGDRGGIDAAAKKLGLGQAQTSTRNYLALFADYAEAHRLSPDQMTFAAAGSQPGA
ncbi:MAG: adenylate cyclase, class 2 [Chloroflexota bacterium]|jgi:adenylate cyclase class IV|nr:adenylate cyclase, class 2 [Chloroflexota bacterium]